MFFLFISALIIIGLKDYNLPPLILSSTANTIQILSKHSKNNKIKRPIRNSALFWESTKLTTKQILNKNNYKHRTTNMFDYQISFFNYRILNFLFQKIFLQNSYYFTCNTKTPFIIDAGSNIGMSVLYFKKLYPNSNILCFEPDPVTFRILNKNIKQNGLTNIKTINKAISSNEKPIIFYTNNDAPGHPCMSIISTRINNQTKPITIPSAKLSSFINREVDFLKMDIEGAETDVIQELAQSKKINLIKQMIIEFHHHIYPNKKDLLATILKTLEDSGFTYQINADCSFPFVKEQKQDILIFAYKN